MLKDLTDEKLIRLNIEAADWEEAIRKSAQPLIDEHKVKPSYVDDMITGVKENGPYIVLTKHVALTRQTGVRSTGKCHWYRNLKDTGCLRK